MKKLLLLSAFLFQFLFSQTVLPDTLNTDLTAEGNPHYLIQHLHIIDSDITIEPGTTSGEVVLDGHVRTTDTHYVQFGSLTSTERDALTAANGMVIYNSTTNKFQGYENGSWVNLV